MKTSITIFTDSEGRAHLSQNEGSTLTTHEVEQLPPLAPRTTDNNLYDGYHIYKNGTFTFGYDLNVNKCYGAINDFKAQLKKTDYLELKRSAGCDMSEYEDWDWEADRSFCRDEQTRIKQLIKIK